MTLYDDRLDRTLDAIYMRPVDKIPYSYSGCAYVAREMGVKIADFLADYDKACDATIRFVEAHPAIDTLHSPIFSCEALQVLWLSNIKKPGRELDEDELWQVDEKEILSIEDYQRVVDEGFDPWRDDLLKNKLGNPMPALADYAQKAPAQMERLFGAGIPVMNGAMAGSPIETFCGGRGMTNFFMDVIDEPELVKEAFDEAHKSLLGSFVEQLKATHPVGAWVGGWRAAPALMSHDMWMEYCWVYIKDYIMACIDNDVIPVLHFDSDWNSEIETLKELPARKCLLMLDGFTDMRRARDILEDRMALMGDVPASMLTFGTADECYKYVTSLIDDVAIGKGKTGLVISSGCDCPLNAKPENVAAMIQATQDYAI